MAASTSNKEEETENYRVIYTYPLIKQSDMPENMKVEVKYHRCQFCRKVKVKYQVRMEETNKYSASCKQKDADAGNLWDD